jgi:cytochrome c oxidase cbb3-type subunit 3
MRPNVSLAAAAAVFVSSIYAGGGAQGPPPQTPPVQTPPAQAPPAGGRQGRGGTGFPKTMRPLADPAVIERGTTLYGINCRLCHGADLRGGDMGGINLLRSQLVLNDQDAELIIPVVHGGRSNPGMPPMPPLPLPDDDIKAIAAYIRSVLAKSPGQGGPPPGPPVVLDIVVGDAAAGQRYFAANCASCHSATGDLAGLAARYPEPMQLQNSWVAGRGAGAGRGGRGAPAADPGPGRTPKPVTAVVTTANGQRVEGRLDRIDDFIVVLTPADGVQRSFRRSGSTPQVQINDPLEGHRKLLVQYTDKDIHDVTAYLVTLK